MYFSSVRNKEVLGGHKTKSLKFHIAIRRSILKSKYRTENAFDCVPNIALPLKLGLTAYVKENKKAAAH